MPSPLRAIYTAITLLVVSTLGPTATIAKPLGENTPTQAINKIQLIAQEQSAAEQETFEVQPSLSPEQTEQIKAIFEEYKPQIQTAFGEYQNSLISFEELIGTNPSNEEVRERRTAVLDNERIIEDLLFERTMAIRDVLTEEQKASIAEYMRQQIAEQ